MPLGIKEGFSYGGRLCSVVGWLGYGGNLTWRKQEYFVEYVLGVPISQGSLAKMQRWFQSWLVSVGFCVPDISRRFPTTVAAVFHPAGLQPLTLE